MTGNILMILYVLVTILLLARVNDVNIEVKRVMWKVSKSGYYHAPILSFSFGSDGFNINILFWVVIFDWIDKKKDLES